MSALTSVETIFRLVSRRGFMQTGLAGIAGLSLPGLLPHRVTAATPGSTGRITSVSRVFFLTLFCLCSMIAAVQADDPAPVSDTAVRDAVSRSLPFLEKEGVAWMKAHGCMSCHHVPLLLWSYRSAQAQGFKVDSQKLAELRYLRRCGGPKHLTVGIRRTSERSTPSGRGVQSRCAVRSPANGWSRLRTNGRIGRSRCLSDLAAEVTR